MLNEVSRRVHKAQVFGAGGFISLLLYYIHLKLMTDRTTSRPFSARTLPLPKVGASYKREIVDFSRMKHGRPKTEVESAIVEASVAEPIRGSGEF